LHHLSFMYLNGMFFQKLCVDFEGKIYICRGRLVSKSPCDIPCKNIQKSPKILPKGLFLTFCMRNWKGHCDQWHIVTIIRPWVRVFNQLIFKLSWLYIESLFADRLHILSLNFENFRFQIPIDINSLPTLRLFIEKYMRKK
jgi:hypothetical protein